MIGLLYFVLGVVVGAVAAFFVVKNNLKRTQELFVKVDAANADLDGRIAALAGLLRSIEALLKK